jgi:hypothetical protein
MHVASPQLTDYAKALNIQAQSTRDEDTSRTLFGMPAVGRFVKTIQCAHCGVLTRGAKISHCSPCVNPNCMTWEPNWANSSH